MEGLKVSRDRTSTAAVSPTTAKEKDQVDNKTKPLLKGENTSRDSPPEFLVRRNEILQKRSLSCNVGGCSDSEDNLQQGAVALGGISGSGPLKGTSDERTATSLLFKGVHPSSGKTGSASSHFGRQLSSDSRDCRNSATSPSGGRSSIAKKEVAWISAADGVWSTGGEKTSAPVTLPSRYVDDRAVVQSRGLGLNTSHPRHKMGEDSSDSATIKDISATTETDKALVLERHSEGEKTSFKFNKTHGNATKIPNGVSQGPRLYGDPSEQEFSYGPGFVDKLKSRFISLSLNDKTKTIGSNLRRFSSLENVLDSDSEYTTTNDVIKRKRPIGTTHNHRMRFRGATLQPRNSFKRAKSMETLLLESVEQRIKPSNGTNNTGRNGGQRPISMIDNISGLNFINENVVIIEKKKPSGMKVENMSGVLSPREELGSYGNNKITKKRDVNRQMSNISDEELPKPDTVKTYKLFFEPVGNKRSQQNNSNARKSTAAAQQHAHQQQQQRSSAKNNLNNKTNLQSSPSNHSSSSPNSNSSKNIPFGNSKSPAAQQPPLLAQPKPSAKENNIVNANQIESQQESSPKTVRNGPSGVGLSLPAQIVNNSLSKEPTKLWNNLDAPESSEKSNAEESELSNESNNSSSSQESRNETKISNQGLTRVVNNHHGGTPLSLNLLKAGDTSGKPPALKKQISPKISPVEDGSENETVVLANNQSSGSTSNSTTTSTLNNRIGAIPFVSSKSDNFSSSIGNLATPSPEKMSPEKVANLTFQKPESEMSSPSSSSLPVMPPPTVAKEVTNNRVENSVSFKGPVSASSVFSVDLNGVNNLKSENEKPKIVNATSPLSSPGGSTDAVKSNSIKDELETGESEFLKPSALLGGNKKSGLWQKNPPTQMTTTIVYNFVGKEVKSHLPTNPTPFGCKPASRPKKKSRNTADNKESGNLRNGLDLGDVGGESNDYDDTSEDDEEDLDELDIGAHLPAASGISFLGENVACPKSSILTRRNKKHNIIFADEEPSVFVYPSEESVYEDLGTSPTKHNAAEPDHQTVVQNGTPSPEEQPETSMTNHVQPQGLRNTPSLGGMASGALSSYTPSMLSSAESFQLGVSRSSFHQAEVPKPDGPTTNGQDSTSPNPKEEELLPADPNETSSWSSSTTSDLLF